MINFIDDFLNTITMYRLVLYYLIFLLLGALGLSFFGLISFSPQALIFSTGIILLVCWLANKIFAGFLKVQANVESVYITALILALIISPPTSGNYLASLSFLFWASVLAMASKFILNLKNKHLFNPAAIAVVITYFTLGQSATWWVGTSSMLFFVAVGGILVIKKVQRFDAVIAFLAAALVTMFALSASGPLTVLNRVLLDSPIIFLAAVMLTEPLTMPPTKDGRIAYGILVGLMFAPQTHLGSFYFTPELALVIGNIFSYVLSPKNRYVLKLKEKKQVGEGVYDFIFKTDEPLKFRPGQYMEWTLGHQKTDDRGNRRYFTLASAPTEADVLLGVKFYDQPSSFKQALAKMDTGDIIAAGQLAGDFTLPTDKNQKLVFMAGGIGITPFRSMLKFLADKNEQREIVLIYAVRNAREIVYIDVFKEAANRCGVKTVFTLSDNNPPASWQGYRGYINEQLLAKEVPDFRDRTFYISGSHVMVDAAKKLLTDLGISRAKIKTDFFPGLA